MKKCAGCSQVKPFTEFHKKGTGYRSRCKICRYSERETSRIRSSEYYRANREKVIASNKSWKEQHKEKMQEYKIEWRKRNRDKALAHWAVSNALRQGKLVKQPCEVCGNEMVHGHHEDYSKQLEVVWLCDNHHKERHGVLINA